MDGDTLALTIADVNAGDGGPLTICGGILPDDLTALLSPEANLSGNWFYDNGQAMPGDTVADNTMLWYIDQTGVCVDTAIFDIEVPPSFELTPPVDTTVLVGTTLQLTALGAENFSWSPSDQLSCDDCPDPIFTAMESVEITITSTDNAGCSESASVMITVTTGSYEIPNIFTPNGDDINDTFGLLSAGEISILEFQIFNRWGEVVHGLPTPWDGRFEGEPAPSDVYVYFLSIQDSEGQIERIKGEVSLIR